LQLFYSRILNKFIFIKSLFFTNGSRPKEEKLFEYLFDISVHAPRLLHTIASALLLQMTRFLIIAPDPLQVTDVLIPGKIPVEIKCV
jgi:hypothetical protein